MLVGTSPAQTVTDVFTFSGTGASQNPAFVTPTQGRDGKLYGTTFGPTSGTSLGSVFKITTTGSGGDLYAFNGTQGANPFGGLTLGSDGSFYGTTGFGGASNEGVVFKITPNGTYTVLHEFAGGADGGNPEAPPIQASDGNFYGTTEGGLVIASTVYKITPSGSFSTIYQFDQAHGSTVPAPLIQGSDGNLYGVAEGGGANNCGTVFRMTRSGTVISTYSFLCGNGGKFPVGPLVQASDGNFYGTTSEGGSQNLGTIFKMNKDGKQVTVLHSFRGGIADGEFPVGGLVQGTDANLYGSANGGGSSNDGVLFSISTSGAYTLLYSFQTATGQAPIASLLQHTSGLFYGTTNLGGANGYGVVYSLNIGLGPFITFVRSAGRVGGPAQILGQALTGATTITFNGIAATSFSVVSDTYMTAVVPGGATTGPVVVTTPSGALTSNKNFIILATATMKSTGAQPPSR